MKSFRVERFGEPLVEVDAELPLPKGTEVLVRIAASGVCHTDLHLANGYFDLGDGKRLAADRIVSPPRTLGHEIAGTVVAVGPDAEGVSVGERRIVYPWLGCEECALCLAGDEHLCNRPRALGVQRDGGFSDHLLVPDPRVLFAFDPLSEEQACTYACAGLTAYSALKKAAPLAADDALLIIGAGGVGLSGVRFARYVYGVSPIVAEPDRAKWESALAAGASAVLDPTADGALREVLDRTAGGAGAAIDFVGAASSFAFGLGALRKAGRLVCVGLFGGSASLSPALVAMKALTIAGSYVGSMRDLEELLSIARLSGLPDLPVSVRTLGAANAALADLQNGTVRGRVVLRP